MNLGSKDEKGQHPVTQYHQNYGFKLEDAVKELPLNNMKSPDQLDLLLYSLKKGNRHEVDIIGNDSRFLLEANPKYKTMNLYDAAGKAGQIHQYPERSPRTDERGKQTASPGKEQIKRSESLVI